MMERGRDTRDMLFDMACGLVPAAVWCLEWKRREGYEGGQSQQEWF